MIAATATTSGISTAGSVPKTKSRMKKAPMPPTSASIMTLGPSLPPEASCSGNWPVMWASTPAGSLVRTASSVCLAVLWSPKVATPAG